MIEALAHDIGTLDRLHQPPAIIAESAASSAYLPIVRKAEPPQQRRFVLNKVYSATSEASAQAYKQVREVRSLTEDMVRIIDQRASAQRENREKVAAMLAVHHAFAERIEVLKSDAALEGFAMSVASKRDFWTFIRSMPFIRKGSLILMDNGNLRAVWKDDQGNQIGLQYLGTGSVQFVIFKHPDRAGGVSRVAGCTSLADIKRQIRAFSLERLLVA